MRWHLSPVVLLTLLAPAALACEFETFVMDQTFQLNLTEIRAAFTAFNQGTNCIFLSSFFGSNEFHIVEATVTATWNAQTDLADEMRLQATQAFLTFDSASGHSPLQITMENVTIGDNGPSTTIDLQMEGTGAVARQPAAVHVEMTYEAAQELSPFLGSCSST